jgi:hypothetical protein
MTVDYAAAVAQADKRILEMCKEAMAQWNT